MTKKELKQNIKYYQTYKEQFFIDCLQSDPNERQYLYNEWIEDFFTSSYNDMKYTKKLILGMLKTNLSPNKRIELLKIYNTL